ncbi:hypothetical protein ATANTOWER_013914 [Ataeniobius toweri]|uniref:Uncharacterized protein n=1 Tax=Ataeniobius toweri TaxID=208326 RepID=A0ABU7BSI2_9TELE|nr:hypothetical protein [Ataeniobius toweri]
MSRWPLKCPHTGSKSSAVCPCAACWLTDDVWINRKKCEEEQKKKLMKELHGPWEDETDGVPSRLGASSSVFHPVRKPEAEMGGV